MKLEVTLWILILVSAALAIVWPKYRAYSLVVSGIVIVAIVATLVLARRGPAESSLPAAAPASTPPPLHVDFEQFHLDNLDKQDPAAKNRIGVTEVRFEQIQPELGSEPGTVRLIRARLYNDSARFTLTDYGYYLEVQDCMQSRCTTVYDQRGQGAVSVPAKQARDVLIAIRDGDNRGRSTFKILGTLNIKLSVTNTRAYQIAPST